MRWSRPFVWQADPVECDRIEWDDADGDTLTLAGSDRFVGQGTSGRALPPIFVQEQLVPLRPGAVLRYVNHAARDVAVPWVVHSVDLANVEQLLRDYLPRFDPVRGDGVLRSISPDGVTRELTKVRYLSGFERVESPPDQGFSDSEAVAHQLGTLLFRAYDPYWYGPEEQEVFDTGTVVGSFFPIPNPVSGSFITLVASEVYASATIVNTGDVDAQPVWTIDGPGTNIVLRDAGSGARLQFDGLTLTAGQVATIDTRDGVMTALLDDGTNLYPYLTDSSEFWWLPRGSTNVLVELTGATADTEVTLAWRPAHLVS